MLDGCGTMAGGNCKVPEPDQKHVNLAKSIMGLQETVLVTRQLFNKIIGSSDPESNEDTEAFNGSLASLLDNGSMLIEKFNNGILRNIESIDSVLFNSDRPIDDMSDRKG